ncbi:ChaN family lipoprotein [Tropicimonas sp. TH_r6]|uniref:ChaN family lipoprotein n=1 Tax=Tropicimonas sp. TH_r6 TaxID=3082085 RepID=UPI002955DB4A|nr:ChaN family lipoprotein [Tropicimonas sp. TH_r6]MDV7142208.1 ChaN family lipoprotein [Tropicimonas sp. TH_r6]
MRYCLFLAALGVASAASAAELPDIGSFDPSGADIILLGEVHDNPAQHENQASAVGALAPSALVFEMLDAEQAATANATDRTDRKALEMALDWAHSSWPDFSMYHPIFLAAPDAPVYGASVARGDLMDAMSEGAAKLFGAEADRFGLGPLPDTVQQAREAYQLEAHCNALPEEMLPGMVEAQRLRDARFSQTALQALRETGGPVVVITGNGHARRDWGMPVYLAAAAPDVSVLTLAQFEEAAPGGDVPHDFWVLTEAAEREDPCAVFEKRKGG